MEKDNLEKEIFEAVAQQFQATTDELTAQTEFVKDLKSSNSDMVDLIVVLEEKFNLQIPDEEVEKMPSIGHIIQYVRENRN